MSLPHFTNRVNSSQFLAETEGGAGARALAQLALSDCGAVAALRLNRRDPAKIATVVYGDVVLDEGSPIALAVGKQFEAVLKRDNFARFRESLTRAGRLPDPTNARILDLEAAAVGADAAARSERVRATQAALLQVVQEDPGAPDVLWHPHLIFAAAPRLRVTIIPDFILLRHTATGFRVGEIKAYRDRGAYTGPASLRLARLQAAVEVLALQETLATLGVRNVAELVPAHVDFMLRSRNGFFGVVRRQSTRVAREVERLQRVLATASVRVPLMLSVLPAGATLDTREGFEALPYHYTQQCREHCPLALRCATRARAAGAPAILGDDMAAVLGDALTLTELGGIFEGRIAPSSAGAAILAEAFQSALTAVGYTHTRMVPEIRRAS